MFLILLTLMVGMLFGLVFPPSVAQYVLLVAVFGSYVITQVAYTQPVGLSLGASCPIDQSPFPRGRHCVSSFKPDFISSISRAGITVLWFAAGVLLMQSAIDNRLNTRVHVSEQDSPQSLRATVMGFPTTLVYGQQTRISVGDRRFLAYWPKALTVSPGEVWQVECTLRPISPTLSPGAMNPAYQAFLKGDDGRCSIADAQKLADNHNLIVNVQLWLRSWLKQQTIDEAYKPYALALILGDRSALTDRQRQLMRDAHTSHLLVVSGLHLSLVFLMGYGLFGFLGKLFRWHYHRPIGDLQWAMAILGAIIYAALCNFPIPTQRALIMLMVPCVAHYRRRPVAWGQSLSLALIGVLVWDPLAIVQMSAWLSFLAVSALLFGLQGRLTLNNTTWQLSQHRMLLWVKPQWVVAIALAPLLWKMGVPGNPASILVNIVAIPLVSLALLPGLILGIFAAAISPVFLTDMWAGAINAGFALLEHIMVWGSAFQTERIPAPIAIGVFALFGLVVVMPAGLPGKRRVSALLLGVFLTHVLWPKAPPSGLQLFVLDVGQGQSILIHSGGRWLLIDSGPGLVDQGGQLGRVVMPFLRQKGVSRLDLVVFSHNDTDHVGGMKLAPQWLDSPLWLFGEPEVGLHGCYAGQEWAVGSMTVSFLSPFQGTLVDGNSASCVVEVRSEDGCILVPGDIDKYAEYRVLASRTAFTRCAVLVGSHHGSAGSTATAWLTAFQPDLMVFSAGRDNRFGHPAQAVQSKLKQFRIPWRSTHNEGTLIVTQQQGQISVETPTEPTFYWESGW